MEDTNGKVRRRGSERLLVAATLAAVAMLGCSGDDGGDRNPTAPTAVNAPTTASSVSAVATPTRAGAEAASSASQLTEVGTATEGDVTGDVRSARPRINGAKPGPVRELRARWSSGSAYLVTWQARAGGAPSRYYVYVGGCDFHPRRIITVRGGSMFYSRIINAGTGTFALGPKTRKFGVAGVNSSGTGPCDPNEEPATEVTTERW